MEELEKRASEPTRMWVRVIDRRIDRWMDRYGGKRSRLDTDGKKEGGSVREDKSNRKD